jgi:hypothetical protein
MKTFGETLDVAKEKIVPSKLMAQFMAINSRRIMLINTIQKQLGRR